MLNPNPWLAICVCGLWPIVGVLVAYLFTRLGNQQAAEDRLARLARGILVGLVVMVVTYYLVVIPVGYYNYPGLRDSYYTPLEFPYQFVGKETAQCGYIANVYAGEPIVDDVRYLDLVGSRIVGTTMSNCWAGSPNGWFVLDLRTGKVQTFASQEEGEYRQALQAIGLDSKIQLEGAETLYARYWDGEESIDESRTTNSSP